MPRKPRVEVGDWPRLTRFYGIPPSELARTPQWLLRYYAECMTEIEAEEGMAAILVSAYPYLKERAQEEAVAHFRAALSRPRPEVESEPESPVEPTSDEGQVLLAGMGIGVIVESPVGTDA